MDDVSDATDRLVVTFSDVACCASSLVGGKASQLALLTQVQKQVRFLLSHISLFFIIYIYIYVAQKIKEPQIYYWKLHLFERQTKNQYVMFSVSCVSTTCSNTCTTSRRHAGYQATDCRPWNAPPFLLKCNTKIVKIDWLRLSSTNRSA